MTRPESAERPIVSWSPSSGSSSPSFAPEVMTRRRAGSPGVVGAAGLEGVAAGATEGVANAAAPDAAAGAGMRRTFVPNRSERSA